MPRAREPVGVATVWPTRWIPTTWPRSSLRHWPGAVSPWYTMLRRITELSPVLGKFLPLDDYFSHTDMPGRLSKWEPDEYRTPYLMQAIIAQERSDFVDRRRASRKPSAGARRNRLAGRFSGAGERAQRC